MKAVVLEVRGNQAAVLLKNGSVIKIKNKGYAVGTCLEINEPGSRVIKLTFRVACVAAAVVICTVGALAYVTPYAYVSLDVNPSIEYVLNRFDRVLSVNGVNDDGADIVDDIKKLGVRHRTITQAIEMTVEKLQQENYISENEENIVVLAASAGTEQKAALLVDSLQRSITKDNSAVTVKSMRVTPEQVEQAQEIGVTPGKLSIVNELAATEEDPEHFKAEEWLNKPVRDVVRAIDQNLGNAAADAQKAPEAEKQENAAPKQPQGENVKRQDGVSQPNGSNNATNIPQGSSSHPQTPQGAEIQPQKEDNERMDSGRQAGQTPPAQEQPTFDNNVPQRNTPVPSEPSAGQIPGGYGGGADRKKMSAQEMENYLVALEEIDRTNY